MFIPGFAEYSWRLSTTVVRPTANYGTVVTPGASNTKGSYAQLIAGASVTEDVWFIAININSNAVSTAIRDTLLDIGIDEAGGSSYSIKIPDLLCSSAAPYNVFMGGIWYYFPLFIKAGSSIGARAAVNNATAGTLRCWARLYGKPRDPESTRVGHKVSAFGVVTGSSRGTIITPGTTSEGAWTQLGSTTIMGAWWWQLGYGAADASMGAAAIHCDLSAGNSTNKKIIIEDQLVMTDASEQVSWRPLENAALIRYCDSINSGDTTVYGRAQSSAAADTSVSLAAYGLT